MNNYLKNTWVRLGSIVFLGILFRFILDIVYSLLYRNYDLLQSFDKYLFTIIIVYLSFESIFYLNKLLDKKLSWEVSPYRRFFTQWILSFGTGLFFAIVLRWIVKFIFISFTYVNLFDEIVLVLFVLLVTTTLTIIDLGLFLLEKWRFSLAELERFKKENAESQFESLRTQINPHFLFNSLNTLSALIFQDQKKAESFVREMSYVYRYILENRENELITLDKELKIANSYIFLNKIRFEKSLDVKINVPEKSKQLLIAPLTLQLLIENAIKHNIISMKRPLHLDIVLEDNNLVVQNNLQKKEVKEYSSALGLKNIESRYSFLTSRKVDIIENGNEFIVKIPLIEKG